MALVTDKFAMVTGGGTGLGYAIAQRLLEEGAACVTIVGRRQDVLAEAAVKLKALGAAGEVRYAVADVTDEAAMVAAVDQACNDGGALDILVANAGTGFPSPVIEADIDAWRSMLELNVVGTLISIKSAAQKMKKGGGSIVTISSIEGAAPTKWMGSYSTSKAGMEMLSQCAARELGHFGIRVNCVRPGMVPTEIVAASIPQTMQDHYVEKAQIQRLGTPRDIADGVLYFASNASDWVTGQTINICGGAGNRVGDDYSEAVSAFYGEDKLREYLNQ